MTDDLTIDDIIEEPQDETTTGEPGQFEHWRMTVDTGQQPVRIDKFLAEHMQHLGKDCHALHTPAYNAALAK